MANATTKQTDLLLNEIIASDKLYNYQDWSPAISVANSISDPSIIWQQLFYNPWLAMAIYDEIEEKDGAVFSNLDTRKDGLLSKPRRVVPASDSPQDKKVAAFIEETLEGNFETSLMFDPLQTPFESFMYEALDAIAKGMSIGEIIFAEAKDRIYIKEVKFKPQHLFNFGEGALAQYSSETTMYPQTGPLRLRQGVLIDGVGGNELLPEQKFFIFSYRPRRNNRWGNPLLRKVYWASWIKRGSLRQWLRYLEKGNGTIVTRYQDGAAVGEQQTALDAAASIVEESAVAMPKKFLVEVYETVRAIGSSHKEIVDDFCINEIARVILGQTLTSRGSEGGGGSRALGGVHNAVRGEKIEADAKGLEAAVNARMVAPLTLLNFGPDTKPPTWKIDYEPKEDADSTANRMEQMWNIGLPLSKENLYETLQIATPLNDADVLVNANPQATQDNQNGKTAEFAEKKTLESERLEKISGDKSNSKTERFRRLRPSMIRFSDE